jgi:hypothetical protein
MVLVGFGSGISLVWIIGSSLLVSSFVLYGETTHVLYEATTLVLYWTIIIVLCGTCHPLWLSFRSIGWFGLWLGFELSSSVIFGLRQDCEAIIWIEQFLDPFPPINELILGWVF